MPRRLKSEKRAAEVLAPIPPEILDQIAPDGPMTAADVDAVMRRFKKAIIERALGAELSYHLGYPPGAANPTRPPIIGMARVANGCSLMTGPWRSTCPAIATARSSRS